MYISVFGVYECKAENGSSMLQYRFLVHFPFSNLTMYVHWMTKCIHNWAIFLCKLDLCRMFIVFHRYRNCFKYVAKMYDDCQNRRTKPDIENHTKIEKLAASVYELSFSLLQHDILMCFCPFVSFPIAHSSSLIWNPQRKVWNWQMYDRTLGKQAFLGN